MKLFIFVIGFLLAFLAVVVLLVLSYLRRGVKKFTQAVTGDYDDEEAFRRMADKHYRKKDGPQFDKDYFKSKTGSTTADGKQQQAQRPRQQQAGQQQQGSRQQARSAGSTAHPSGVTIIDGRDQSGQRKIFADDEGEYVDFTEA